MPMKAVAFALHLTPVSLKHYKGSLLLHLLNAAKACVPLCWKQTTVDRCRPSVYMWFARTKKNRHVKTLMTSVNHCEERCIKIWLYWMDFMCSPKYRDVKGLQAYNTF